MEKVFTIKLAGPAGLGIKSGGQLLSQILIAHGFSVHDYNEYPSLVRGGHNTYQVTFTTGELFAPHHTVDLFFSITPGHWQQHLKEFTPNTLIAADEKVAAAPTTGHLESVPLKDMSIEVGTVIVTNTICVGLAAFLFHLDPEICHAQITQQFGKNAEMNIKAFDAGWVYAQKHLSAYLQSVNPPKGVANRKLVDGNEAYGWGFIQGGGNFYSAYPMTPATGALHFLAAKQQEYKLHVVHAEDEIGVASIASGAAFAGARAAVGTSGGGFALMNETISYCGVTEIGMVFYLVSRPGPATGLPTYTSQGDLLYAINSGHGEFPKIVLAPSSQLESFEFSALSLDLAAAYQLPVLVVSDKFLAESAVSLEDLSQKKVTPLSVEVVKEGDGHFKRYALTPTGVSPVALPGTKGAEFIANSYEHDEYGYSAEDSETTVAQLEKRHRKLDSAKPNLPKAVLHGSPKATKLIVCWGSVAGPVLEALRLLPAGHPYAALVVRTVWPIDPEIEALTKNYPEIITVENNQTAQLTTVLRSQINFHPTRVITKFDGRPFYPEELIKEFT
ncbi:2-oxoacid:acceptor oxidoreductase subunit alpha [Patescibacteria group bacterium]|nr:2-oxoacid:acceptor oxidoreductase subunit alpha [Patescibacteria group bacterium]